MGYFSDTQLCKVVVYKQTVHCTAVYEEDWIVLLATSTEETSSVQTKTVKVRPIFNVYIFMD